MSSEARGTLTELLPLLPSFQHIASSTNASPIVVTTTAPHGMLSDDTVVIDAHLVNTNANGTWEVVVLSATTFQLVGSTGNGVGGATGTARFAGFGSTFQIPSAGDARDIGAISAAFEAVADRETLILYLLNFKQQVYAGGHTTYHEDSILELTSGSVLQGDVGSELLGTFTLGDGVGGSLFQVAAHSAIALEAAAALTTAAGSIVSILGDLLIGAAATFELQTELEVQASGSIVLDSGAHLDVHGGAAVNFTGSTSQITGTCLFNSWNAAAGSSLTFNGSGAANALTLNNTAVVLNSSSTVADAATTTKTGPTVYSGATGYVGGRSRYLGSNTTGTEVIDPSQHEVFVSAAVQTADVIWKFQNPPNNERMTITVNAYSAKLNGHALNLQDAGGNPIGGFTGAGNVWFDLRWEAGASTWIVIRSGNLP